ncbi:CRISPR-associated helicase Cas3' [Thermococcus sp.]
MINKSLLTELGLDDFSKTSHKNGQKEKTLAEHIDEIVRVSMILAEKHNLEEYTDILEALAWWHDLGKLNPKWDINKKKKPPHSALSAYIFLKHSHYRDPRIFYLILKHHSHLTPIPSNPNYISKNILGRIQFPIDYMEALRLIQEKFQYFNEAIKISEQENVLYVDLFGVFKTTDIISAMSESKNELIKANLYLNLSNLKQQLQAYVTNKGLKFDENKWRFFLEMATSGKDLLFSAPTGWGKTFASLTIASTKNPTHIIYVLPTITAIRKMKKTIQKLLKISVNENYYFADFEKITSSMNPESSVDWELFVSKSFLSQVTLTTLDQIILTFLHVGKYFLKRFHFRNALFIFDEFHLYPLNGLYILLYFLKKYRSVFGYNIKTVFMSATVHPVLEDLICTYISPSYYNFVDEYKKKRRYLYSLHKNDITDDAILEDILEKGQKGNVLVICNTVEKAIKVYLLLKYQYKAKNVLLLHSRFTYKDRIEKEQILEKQSRSSNGFIFVSTQVAEVSLDVSFDYLFTELAPLPSLIQRFGRVNRYSSYTSKKNVKILRPLEIDSNKRYPYNVEELRLTKTILEELEENIKTELDLIEKFREIPVDLDHIKLKEIDRYIQKWEESTRYFFSIDLGDKELDKILNFRETNTTLVIPECFIDEISGILTHDDKYRFSRIKGYFTPIPIWWLFSDDSSPTMCHNLPVLSSSRFLYSREVGYFDSEKLSAFIGEIDVCEREKILDT